LLQIPAFASPRICRYGQVVADPSLFMQVPFQTGAYLRDQASGAPSEVFNSIRRRIT
jgi:hypothetical protein